MYDLSSIVPRSLISDRQPARGAAARFASLENIKKKEVSDFLVIGYLYLEINCNFIYVTSFLKIS